MNKNKHIIAGILGKAWILPLTILFLLYGCANQDFSKDIKSIMDKLEQLEKKLATYEEQNKEIKELKQKVEEYKAAIEEQLTKLTQRVAEKSPAIEAAKAPVQEKAAVQEKAIHGEGTRYHTVSRGETLFSISKKYGISVAGLRRLNNLKEGQNIQTNQKLLISK
jgi:membrane-bound lytic murein transglycosylase D